MEEEEGGKGDEWRAIWKAKHDKPVRRGGTPSNIPISSRQDKSLAIFAPENCISFHVACATSSPSLSLFPPVSTVSRSWEGWKFNIRCNRWELLRVEYKIQKVRSGTADCWMSRIELFWIYIYIVIWVIDCSIRWWIIRYMDGKEISIWKLSTVAIEL